MMQGCVISELTSFTLLCRKMVRHTLKILQQMLQGFYSVCDHFTTLRSKGLNMQEKGIFLELNTGLQRLVLFFFYFIQT